MSSPSVATRPIARADELIAGLEQARERTLALIAPISDEDLERVHSRLMSPLAWDLGHIAAFEDLWAVHRFGGEPMLRPELADVYDAFETPRAGRGELAYLRPAAARDYLAQVRERTLELIALRGIGDGFLLEMVIRHEHQHNETMLQTLSIARLSDYRPPRRVDLPQCSGGLTGLELVEVPGGAC